VAALRAVSAKLGHTPPGRADEDPRKVVGDALGYVTNNRRRMDSPRHWQLGLPMSSAPAESVIEQVNRRMKRTEKLRVEGGAEAVLQVRAAYLSENGRADCYWARQRTCAPAIGAGRLRSAA
jgi:hypothetical protein